MVTVKAKIEYQNSKENDTRRAIGEFYIIKIKG